jgi:quinol monooxygenase YgiN
LIVTKETIMYYGTIARAKVKPGALDSLKATMEAQEHEPASVAVYAYQMDGDSDELYIVAVFKDREAYLANADSPEQHERYLQMRHWLVEDPEWHDGTVIYHHN